MLVFKRSTKKFKITKLLKSNSKMYCYEGEKDKHFEF